MMNSFATKPTGWPEQIMYDIQLHSFQFYLFFSFDNWETADVAALVSFTSSVVVWE